MTDAIRLSFGTLTALRVPAPGHVDRKVAARAMAWAPVVGLIIGSLAAAVGGFADWLGLSPLICAVIVIGSLAVLTRGIHLDGLADASDALGSGRRGADGLAVMSRSDIGPFGVMTLVIILLLQIFVLATEWAAGHGPSAIIIAVVASRATLPLMCGNSMPAAKTTGLGSTVASTVGRGLLGVSLLVALILVVGIAVGADDAQRGISAAAALLIALGLASAFVLRCVDRFGGVTGDVLGAGVEIAMTGALLALAVGLT